VDVGALAEHSSMRNARERQILMENGGVPPIVDDIIVQLESVSIIHVPGRIPEVLVGVSRICRLNGCKLMHGEKQKKDSGAALPIEIMRYSIAAASGDDLPPSPLNGRAFGRLEIAQIGTDRVLVLVSPANEGGNSTDGALQQALVDLSREIYIHLKASRDMDDEI